MGIDCGGSCPKGRLAEDGIIPTRYPLVELESKDYRIRTRQNILDSHGTLITSFGPLNGGSKLTYDLCLKHGRPALHIDATAQNEPSNCEALSDFVRDHFITILNVAGPRASRCNRIYNFTYELLKQFLKKILLDMNFS